MSVVSPPAQSTTFDNFSVLLASQLLIDAEQHGTSAATTERYWRRLLLYKLGTFELAGCAGDVDIAQL